jgi:peptidoglycan/xylan/chitin deacetylase (PgdA/CDA1 family)
VQDGEGYSEAGLALERHPLAAEAIRTAGFDVCRHGWRWIKHYELTRAQDRQHIAKAVASFELAGVDARRRRGRRFAGWTGTGCA